MVVCLFPCNECFLKCVIPQWAGMEKLGMCLSFSIRFLEQLVTSVGKNEVDSTGSP